MAAVSKGLRMDESVVHLTYTDVYTFPILQMWTVCTEGVILQSRFFMYYLRTVSRAQLFSKYDSMLCTTVRGAFWSFW